MKKAKGFYIPKRGVLVKTATIMKHIFILFSVLFYGVAWAQPHYDFSTLVGTYDGYPFDLRTGEVEEAVKVKVELTADFTLSLRTQRNGNRIEINEKINPQKAKIAQNKSLEFHFKFANTNNAFSDVYFSLMPPSTGYEGVFISFIDRENKSLFFQMNKEGGDPKIPGAAESLTGRELEKKLHQQFTALFADAEKGFTFRDGEKKEGYTVYLPDLYLTHTESASLYLRESGVSYYFAAIKPNSGANKWEYRDTLIEAIESYPRSEGFRIVELEKRDYTQVYALKKLGETVGFIEIKESEADWIFRLFLPLDSGKLKRELAKGIEWAENDFWNIRGKKLRVFTFLEETIIYQGTRFFYGTYSSEIQHSSIGDTWVSSFDYYPYAALAYQFDKMDLSFSEARKIEGERNEKGMTLRYEKPTFAFEISLLNYRADEASLRIAKKRKSNTPVYLQPAKTYHANGKYPVFSGRYEGDDLYQLMGRHWSDPAIKKWLGNPQYGFEKSRFGDSEFCIYDADGIWLTFSKSHLTQIELFNNASPAIGIFKGALPKGIQLGAAASSINSIPVSWRQESSSYMEFEEEGITTLVFFDDTEQRKISSVRIRKKIIIDATEDVEKSSEGGGLSTELKSPMNYPPFNGQYEGDDLFQLLDRDFDDPAITALINEKTIKKVNIGTDPKRERMSGNGIGLEFCNHKLIKISLSSYSFKGRLPQGLEFGMSPSEVKMSNRLKWMDQGDPYMCADYNDQQELRVDFDENSNIATAKVTFVFLNTNTVIP